MPTETLSLELLIKAEVGKAIKDHRSYQEAADRSGESNQRLEANNKGLKLSFTELASKIAVARQAIDLITGAWKRFRDTALLGAELEQQAAAFKNIATSAGLAADSVLADMRAAAQGTVSDMDLMATASRAAILGIPLEHMERFTEIASASATVMGTSVVQALNDLATGTARYSQEILDNQGINVRMGETMRDYAATLGTTAENLSQVQRQEAFRSAVLKAGAELIERAASASAELTNVQAYEAMQSALANMNAELALGTLQTFRKIVDEVSKFALGIAEAARSRRALRDFEEGTITTSEAARAASLALSRDIDRRRERIAVIDASHRLVQIDFAVTRAGLAKELVELEEQRGDVLKLLNTLTDDERKELQAILDLRLLERDEIEFKAQEQVRINEALREEARQRQELAREAEKSSALSARERKTPEWFFTGKTNRKGEEVGPIMERWDWRSGPKAATGAEPKGPLPAPEVFEEAGRGVPIAPDFERAQTAAELIRADMRALGADLTKGAMNAGLGLLTEMGRNLSGASDSAGDFKSSFADAVNAFMAQLPQHMLMAGLNLLADPLTGKVGKAIGIALIVGSGIVAIGAGITSERSERRKRDRDEAAAELAELESAAAGSRSGSSGSGTSSAARPLDTTTGRYGDILPGEAAFSAAGPTVNVQVLIGQDEVTGVVVRTLESMSR